MEKSEFGSIGSGEGGNTISPSLKRKNRGSGAYRWGFTYNNYPENWEALLAPCFRGAIGWAGGHEIAETGTHHIQGYVEFKSKVRPVGYRGAPKEIHWGDDDGKPSKGTRAQNLTYCAKEGREWYGTFKKPREVKPVVLYGWQLEALKQSEEEPDERKIFWWWSEEGSRGKTAFCRYMVMNKDALICDGRPQDMKYLITKYHEKKGNWPDIIIFNVPRDGARTLSYRGIETVKDGVFASTKFECEAICMPHAHVYILANFDPPMDNLKMSNDRWIVNKIEDEKVDGEKVLRILLAWQREKRHELAWEEPKGYDIPFRYE